MPDSKPTTAVEPAKRGSKLLGIVGGGKGRSQQDIDLYDLIQQQSQNQEDGQGTDSRRRRYNSRKAPTTVISQGMTELSLDDETTVADSKPRPLGIGRMTEKEVRAQRYSSQAPALQAPMEEEEDEEDPFARPVITKRSSTSRSGSQKVKTAKSKKSVSREAALAALTASSKPRKSRPQPVVAEESLEDDEDDVFEDTIDAGQTSVAEPADVFDDDDVVRILPAKGPATDVEAEESDIEPASQQAPLLSQPVQAQSVPAVDSEDDDSETEMDAEPAVRSAPAVAALPVAAAVKSSQRSKTSSPEIDDVGEDVPPYDEEMAQAAPPEKEKEIQREQDRMDQAAAVNGKGKGKQVAEVGLGASVLAAAGAILTGRSREPTPQATSVTREVASPEPQETASPRKASGPPGSFGTTGREETADVLSDDDSEAAVVDAPVHTGSAFDEGPGEMEDVDIGRPASPAAQAAPAVLAAAAPAALAARPSTKRQTSSPKVTRKGVNPQDKADAEYQAAMSPVSRTISPPERPQRSKAREPVSSKGEAKAVAETQPERSAAAPAYRSYSKKGKGKGVEALAGAGAGAGAAAAIAANREKEPEILSEASDDPAPAEEPKKQESVPLKRSGSQRAKSANAPQKASKKSRSVKKLNAVQRHYFLKALVCIQMQSEWEELEKLGALTLYGYPFSPERSKLDRLKKDKSLSNEYTSGDQEEDVDDPYANDNDQARRLENLQEPYILRHLFHTHLMTFPGLGQAPLVWWQERIQVFFDEMAARNFSTSVERSEYSKRRFYSLAATRYLGGYFARGIGVRGPGELRGPGPGEKGSEKWGVGKGWGKGTVKRGLDRPIRIDDALWQKIDNLFGDGEEGKVWRRAGRESTRVRSDWQAWKEQIIENEAGLEETIDFLDVSKIRNLPAKYRNTEEWARNHAAYLLHSLFVSSPSADSVFGVVKGVHALFPYWGAKQLLKYTNAQTLIEGILNLLLARPAGAKSLIQRIATYVIGSEGSTLQKEYTKPLLKEINDKELTDRLDEYVSRGNRAEGRSLRGRAEKTGDDVLTIILLTASGTSLSRTTQNKVVQLQHSFANSPYRGNIDLAYPSSTPFAKEYPEKVKTPSWNASRTEEDEARKFAQLKLYLRDSLKKRDREQAVKVASGALVPTIVKDFLQIVMYDAIKKIANVADLSARLGDLQAFIEDMIDLKKKKEDSIQAWVALAARHENSLYFLVHECSGISGPLWEWCQIGLDYMAMGTTDPVHPADRSAKDLEINLEELLQDSRLSDKDVELILEEVDELVEYTKWSKVAYELQLRQNFLLARPDAATTSKLTEEDVPTEAMREEIRDVDTLMRELMEGEGVAIDDGALPNEARGTEAREQATFWFDVMDPLGHHLKAETDVPDLRYEPLSVTPPIPCLKYLRKALPCFNDVLKEKLPDWRNGDANGPKKDSKVKRSSTMTGGASRSTKLGSGSLNKSSSMKARPIGSYGKS